MARKHKTPQAKPATQVEAKVSWTTWAAGVLFTAAAAVIADPSLIDQAPPWVRALVAFIVGTGIINRIGFYAPHTDRTDVNKPPFNQSNLAHHTDPTADIGTKSYVNTTASRGVWGLIGDLPDPTEDL